jgi:hypothetical protein
VEDIQEVPVDEQLIISRYIDNPLLLNGLKFDLRVYVMVTSFEPLRIYVYNEGLARFASEPYHHPGTTKESKYAHLTNYSINKRNEKFVQNLLGSYEDETKTHKWSFSTLSKHLESLGVDLDLLWSRIYDVIIKSLLSIDPVIITNFKRIGFDKGLSCFELFGFDILIDSNLK